MGRKRIDQEVLNQLRELRDAGYTQKAAAEKLGRNAHAVSQLCLTYKIQGWPRGAAARDQTGINNSQYINGLSRGTVNRLSKRVLQEANRDLYTCEECGKRDVIPLNRHHVNKNRSENTIDNLQVLCVSCHTKWHALERREIKAIRASL